MGETEIGFQHGSTEIAGLLLRPSGEGPHPAVIFIHGSGPENRDGGGLYRSIWKHFTEQGFACLAWDKPGVGESTGDWRTQGYQERANEALAGLQFLQAQKDIDRSRIGFWGLSEGGLVSALAAVLDKNVAFIISVSSPAGSLVETEVFRTEAEMRAEKATEEAIRAASDVTMREMELVRKGASLEEIIAVSEAIRNESWFETFDFINYGQGWTSELLDRVKLHVDFSSESVLVRVQCPVLAIWGERDCTVPAVRSCEIFQECLTISMNRDVTFKIFPKADHALFPTVTGGMRELLSNWKDLHEFVPNYLETMTEWLKRRFPVTD